MSRGAWTAAVLALVAVVLAGCSWGDEPDPVEQALTPTRADLAGTWVDRDDLGGTWGDPQGPHREPWAVLDPDGHALLHDGCGRTSATTWDVAPDGALELGGHVATAALLCHWPVARWFRLEGDTLVARNDDGDVWRIERTSHQHPDPDLAEPAPRP